MAVRLYTVNLNMQTVLAFVFLGINPKEIVRWVCKELGRKEAYYSTVANNKTLKKDGWLNKLWWNVMYTLALEIYVYGRLLNKSAEDETLWIMWLSF